MGDLPDKRDSPDQKFKEDDVTAAAQEDPDDSSDSQ